MKSSQYKDSKTTSEENNEQEPVKDDLGMGRSYECVFCKRGFTTAQALGGHMNIHRRDRPRISRQPTTIASVSNKPDKEYACTGFFPPVSSYPPLNSPAPEAQMNYHMYLPPSTSSTAHPHTYHADDSQIQKQRFLGLFGENRSTSLSLQIGPTCIEDREKEDELDLELRLGHDL
ncbi:hypothetical protein HHK36_026870 [Tetracentron sinense]|uniref:C2H2-type domain-containing protein n=1 Tax=Tetracentron sinense TaxID=13715 RepID=A0A835D5W1_TETSI|nr:hypothetical protein HHK36_026870 [Tetracentron sinense]